jgi:hypothetical protein
MSKFPFSKTLFWDVDITKMSIDRNPTFIIERVLVRGGMNDVKILFSIYNREQLKQAVLKSRNLDKLTANYMSNYLKIPLAKIHVTPEYY